jgi:hypothetical protein
MTAENLAVKDTIILIPLVVIGTVVRFTVSGLFGDTGMTVDPAVSALVGNLGVVGILIWYLYYHTRHTYPDMLKKFADERALDRVEAEKTRQSFERENGELRDMLIQTFKEMRTAVHDVKDTAQSAIIKTEQAATRAEMARESKS